jgi:glycerophosphoryl diester phosphodiesterase
VIDLRRRDGRPLVIGHRGAPAVAPENTISSFRAAVELGVDLVELDVLALERGPLVVAHSDRLEEITHGVASGRVGGRTLAELQELAPELPTLDDVLGWLAGEGEGVGALVDLKLRSRADEVALAFERHGLGERAVVSTFHADVLRDVSRASARIRLGFTYPEDRLGVARHPALGPAIRASLAALRATLPARLPRLLARSGASALMLNSALVTEAVLARARELGTPVLAWTVDDATEARRLVAAGVDGVITNDPGMLVATLAA